LSVRPARRAQATLVNVLLLGGITAHAQATDPGADATTLAPVKVTANTDDSSDGYVARKSTVGTKTDTPLVEVPQSISVVTRQQMDDQQPQSLNEALRYSVGVVPESEGTASNFWSASSLQMRGFTPGVYMDGLQDDTPGNDLIDPYFFESVSVLGGPSSVLFGQASPGGIVNIVSKRPTDTPLHEVFFAIGNWNRYQAGFDFGGPIDQAGQFLYRLTGFGLTQDTQMVYTKHQRVEIAPAFTWRPDADTHLTVLVNLTSNPAVGDYADLPAVGTALPDPKGRIATSFLLGDPNFNSARQRAAYLSYEFEHRFSDALDFQQNARFTNNDNKANMMWPLGLEADDETLDRYAFVRHQDSRSYLIDNRLKTQFNSGPLQNTVLVGLNFSKFIEHWAWNDHDEPPINIFNPVYYQAIIPPDPTDYSTELVAAHQTGVYAQDQVALDRWRFLLGARQDWVQELDTYQTSSSLENDHRLTYRAGVVYLFDSGFAPYASYSTSFQPQFGNTESGTPFVPTLGRQYEAGVKFQLPGARSFVTAAVYSLTEQNVLTTDPLNPNFQVQVGEIRSRGVELSAHGSLTESLNLIASYTYLDSRYLRSDTSATGVDGITVSTEGKHQYAVPGELASLWADYTFHQRGLQGMAASAGVRYTADSYGDAANSFLVPSITLVDAAIRYELGAVNRALDGLKLQLNVSNLLDKTYVASCSYGTCNYGLRRTVYGNATYSW
jgi:iron complex outermembrane receptor protein